MLAKIQSANLFADGKHFVDMVGKTSEQDLVQRFQLLGPNPEPTVLADFVSANFDRPGYELRAVIPRDWEENPCFLAGIADPLLRSFAKTVHSKWKTLLRQIDAKRICDGCATSVLRLPQPFVVPGGRFRELYYWDSFWILEGLYVSGMCDTARMTIENFKWLIETYGFVPNGSRTYYLNRSHPPLFTMMAKRFMESCVEAKDKRDWLKALLPLLDREYLFWQTFRQVELPNPNNPQKPYALNSYHANTETPRSESFYQDALLIAGTGIQEEQKKKIFQHLASGAESGWDFSSRWFSGGPTNLTSIVTADILPADLNAIIYRNEKILANLHDFVGNAEQSSVYEEKAKVRLEAMKLYLWHAESHRGWVDYDFVKKQPMHDERSFYVSSLAGLWYGAHDEQLLGTAEIEALLTARAKILWEYPGGVPTDNVVSDQQWDFPNVWAPIQQHFITVFQNLGDAIPNDTFWKGKALELAQKFIDTTYCGYHLYGMYPVALTLIVGQLFEKYHAQMVGHPGGGGEYIVQDGFGWTNGVVLWIFKKYGAKLVVPKDCRARANLPVHQGYHVRALVVDG